MFRSLSLILTLIAIHSVNAQSLDASRIASIIAADAGPGVDASRYDEYAQGLTVTLERLSPVQLYRVLGTDVDSDDPIPVSLPGDDPNSPANRDKLRRKGQWLVDSAKEVAEEWREIEETAKRRAERRKQWLEKLDRDYDDDNFPNWVWPSASKVASVLRTSEAAYREAIDTIQELDMNPDDKWIKDVFSEAEARNNLERAHEDQIAENKKLLNELRYEFRKNPTSSKTRQLWQARFDAQEARIKAAMILSEKEMEIVKMVAEKALEK